MYARSQSALPLPAGERSEWARLARTFRVRGPRTQSECGPPSPGSRKRDPTSPLRGEVTNTLLLLRREIHGDAIDAIAQMGGRRPILEHMAEMTAAAAAMHLGADHSVASVARSLDRAGERIVEARPAGAA